MENRLPISALCDEDRGDIKDYLKGITGIENDIDMSNVLSVWNHSKARLFNEIFNHKLRFSVPVKAFGNKNTADMLKSISMAAAGVLFDFVDFMYAVENTKRAKEGTALDAIKMFSPQSINDGVLDKDEMFLDNGEALFLPKGTKIMRAIRKVMEFYSYGNMEAFRRFRDQVSVIKTTEEIDAEMVFSIHPADFLTMSDNNNGWSSCTSLTKGGSYAAGAVEMMNSRAAVVCYIASKEPYRGNIPDKSWRMLCFVGFNSGTVLGGRQYPYFSDELGQVAVETLGKLVADSPDKRVMPYPSNAFERHICECCDNVDIKRGTHRFNEALRSFPNDLGIAPFTLKMCNDFLMFAGNDKFYKYADGTEDCKLNLSGQATCLHCGAWLGDEYDTCDILCGNCAELL